MSLVIHHRSPNNELVLGDELNSLLRRVLRQRGISSAIELDLGIGNLLPPDDMLGIEEAVDILLSQLHKQGKLLIVSDFDADGATSCALAVQALKSMGFAHVDYIVPNRFEYGYGLTPEIVELAKKKNPDFIITVDNGISSHDGVLAAQGYGIGVVITDHHLPGSELPPADAIVNPNQGGCDFASKSLAGVGVIFYLMLALRARLRKQGWFEQENLPVPNMSVLLDLVALGTVADVVPLDQNNRILVNEGLRRIRAGKTRPGILALLEIARRQKENLVASDLGFAVGPRLNAAGRLDDMSLGIECLLSNSYSDAFSMALQLENLNSDRKLIEAEMREEAFTSLEKFSLNEEKLPAGLCVYEETWHQGVIGILASRIKEKYHRPVIAFADVTDKRAKNKELKGSARSIQGFHIRDALDAIASQHPGLVSKFGGHAMAAGLSLDKDCLPEFSRAFARYADERLGEDELNARIVTDGEVSIDKFSLDTAQALVDAGPWGQGFPEPMFDGLFKVRDQRVLADKHIKMVVSPADSELLLDAIAFNVEPDRRPCEGALLRLVYRLDVNTFRNVKRMQLMVDQFAPA
ncbi:MAG: single-stranded-DNA-specific exonuclease RecJ [Gammaproteobacteria bacterium]|nr:single-stranded-DNA-specific exonuclease RecJ [Gammaproteobacteria bacterium]